MEAGTTVMKKMRIISIHVFAAALLALSGCGTQPESAEVKSPEQVLAEQLEVFQQQETEDAFRDRTPVGV